ncbi:TPA: hypothetical protein DDW35_07990 [Candidatus Sumerlaeota bacterium]|jgi:anaerobic magnesium-protoporphyrin IX monomethyl ester cyclase|nr:hypothetical protein [Candidatus Sumerlaeota bacterium]
MRIVLVNPPVIRSNDSALLKKQDDTDNSKIPIGLYSITALLMEEGYEVFLLNHALTAWQECIEQITALTPDVVGVTCFSHNRHPALELFPALKAILPECKFVLGGVHATFLYREILERCPEVDYVVVGEGEYSFLEFVRRLKEGENPAGIPGIAGRLPDGSIDWPGPAEPIHDLGALPIPAKYFDYAIVSTSRGCPFNCSFCASDGMWGRKVRKRPVWHVLDELELLRHKHGETFVSFKDETFTAHKERVIEICKGMLERKLDLWWRCDTRVDCLDEERLYWMRKAGCFYISVGVESGSPAMLKRINKRTDTQQIVEASALIRRFGIEVRFYLIVGLPHETEDDLYATLRLIEKCRPQYTIASDLAVSPGTAVFDEYCKKDHKTNALWFESMVPIILYDPKQTWLRTNPGKKLKAMSYTCERLEEPPLFPFTEAELRDIQSRLSDCMAPNYDLALFLKDAQRFVEAAPFYEKTVEISPAFSKAWLDLGLCYLNTGRDADACAAWEKIEALVEEPVDNRTLALLYRGISRSVDGHDDEAFDLLWRAYALRSDAAEALREIATRGAQRRRWDHAIRAAELWAKLAPKQPDPWHILAVGSTDLGQYGDAQALFNKALQLDSKNPEVYLNYATLMLRAAIIADARGLAQSALRLKPDFTAAQQFLAHLPPPGV